MVLVWCFLRGRDSDGGDGDDGDDNDDDNDGNDYNVNRQIICQCNNYMQKKHIEKCLP